MLDFYADWCAACKELESFTFTNPEVQKRLDTARLLQTDVTANNAEDEALLKRFSLFGPPGIVFFDGASAARVTHKVIGYQAPPEFLASLNAAAIPWQPSTCERSRIPDHRLPSGETRNLIPYCRTSGSLADSPHPLTAWPVLSAKRLPKPNDPCGAAQSGHKLESTLRPVGQLSGADTSIRDQVHKEKSMTIRLTFIARIKVFSRGLIKGKNVTSNRLRSHEVELLPSPTRRGGQQTPFSSVHAIRSRATVAAPRVSARARRLWLANPRNGRDVEHTRSNLR